MIEAAPAAKLPRLSSAERMQRSRERRRKGLRCLTIELREAEIDQLIRRKRLAAEDRENPDALRRAFMNTSTTPCGDAQRRHRGTWSRLVSRSRMFIARLRVRGVTRMRRLRPQSPRVTPVTPGKMK
jgi:hypothetical protein